MKIWDDITSNKKSFFNLVTLIILVLGIPLGVFLAKQVQQFRSQAATDPISWIVEGCVIERNGVKIARCPAVKFAINSPFGGPNGGGLSCPSPSPVCTPSAGSPKTIVELVLDDSSSMACKSGQSDAQCKVKQLQVAVKNIKSLIRSDDVIGIQGLKKILMPINTIEANNTKYDEVINGLRVPNGTPLLNALKLAETEVNRAAGVFPNNPKKVVILVTDGCPDSGQNPKDQGQKLKDLGWTVAVLAIQLGTDAGKCVPYGGVTGARQMMKETASDNLFFEVEDPASIPASLKDIFTKSVCSASATSQKPAVAGVNFSPVNLSQMVIRDAYAADCTSNADCSGTRVCNINNICPGSRNNTCQTASNCNVASPTPTPRPTSTPRGSGSPTPTPRPTDEVINACIGTASYKYAETEVGLTDAVVTPYTDGIIIDHTFSNPNPGTKTIFVWFKPKVGTPVIRQLSINLVPEPEINNVDCQPSNTGTGVTLTLDGINFGAETGTVTGNDTVTTVSNWTTGQVTLTSGSLTCEQVIHIILTTKDGDPAETTYSPDAQIALGAKLFCRAPQKSDQQNVTLSILGEGDANVATESVSIDKDGLVKGLKTKLKSGKKYQIGIKAPKSVRTLSLPFISKGTAQVVLRSRDRDLADRRYINVLPIGDIIALGRGDGVINALDKAELNKEWGLPKGVIDQPGDFNQDGKVNSIDWACMRFDFGSKDAIGPNAQTLSESVNSEDACLQDTFTCPDGTTLKRQATDCEFAACPSVTAAPATAAPTATPSSTPFVWSLNGAFACNGVNPTRNLSWSGVPNATKYDVFENNALQLADQTGLSVSLSGGTPNVSSAFIIKAKDANNNILLTSGTINVTGGSCAAATPTPIATSPSPSPTP